MEHDYWQTERFRLAGVAFAGLLAGYLSGHWLFSISLAMGGYIGWLLYKLHQLHHWLESGSDDLLMPESNGIWDRINYQIHASHKKNSLNKEKLETLLKRLQGIITSLPYATIVLTARNEIDWANQLSETMLRLDPEKDRGQRVENLIRDPALHKLLSDSKNRKIEISSPHDEQLKLALHLIPIQQDMKLLIARDISERVNVQQMRKNFIANASHELRTPLTVIAGYLEIMISEAGDDIPEHLQPAVQAAYAQSARMQDIIEDLLTLSRLENSELEESKNSQLNMASIVRGVVDTERSIDQADHIVHTDHVDESVFLQGSQSEITSVCSNLIHNAFRYTPRGTVIHIIWQEVESGDAQLIVRDEGEGIPTEHLTHLTERFYRVDKGRSQDMGGTGLGLAIVQHIVQRHGGQLFIRSELGTGSEFEVVFPASRVIQND